MVERSLRGKVAIVGIGETTYPGAAEDGGTPPIATIATIRRRLVAGLGVEGERIWARASNTAPGWHVTPAGLRNPCTQLERIRPGLMKATLERDPDGNVIRTAGIMGIILTGGEIRVGDPIDVELPPPPHRPLAPV